MTIHTIVSGDSIYSIARQYGVPPSRIIADNLLDEPNRLTVGQDLVILYPSVTHTVRGGETLASIAARYGTTTEALYRNNPILGGTPGIYPGQSLNIAYETPAHGSIESIGYAYPSIEPATLRRTLPYLTYLSVFSYGIREDGTLIPPEGNVEAVLAAAREYNTVPLLVLTSLSEEGTFSSTLAERVLTDTDYAAQVISSVVEVVRAGNYGGVDVDFEYIPGNLAASYAAFLDQLEDALEDGKIVFVSLAPKTSADQPGLLYEGHDYRALGDEADSALLMTYEWGYTYGPPMPISPLNEVRRVLDYAVTEIERDKIFLGVPNYGYDWALPYVRGESRAESLSNVAAVTRAREKKAAIQYDSFAEAPYYSYFDRPSSYADAVEHMVWFENARSADAMLRLVADYRLRGIGVWNIMRYFPSLWTVLNQLYSIRKMG